jgi:hypothetical protein
VNVIVPEAAATSVTANRSLSPALSVNDVPVLVLPALIRYENTGVIPVVGVINTTTGAKLFSMKSNDRAIACAAPSAPVGGAYQTAVPALV